MAVQAFSNALLAALPKEEQAWLLDRLHLVPLQRGQILVKARRTFDRLLFVRTGCVLARAGVDQADIAVSLIGRDGMIGASLALDIPKSAHTFEVCVPGDAYELSVPLATDALNLPGLRASVLRYIHAQMLDISETAAFTAHLQLRARLARLLSIMFERSGQSKLEITHDKLSSALGVRRPGITVALHELEGEHLITSVRGAMKLRDANGLALAGEQIRWMSSQPTVARSAVHPTEANWGPRPNVGGL